MTTTTTVVTLFTLKEEEEEEEDKEDKKESSSWREERRRPTTTTTRPSRRRFTRCAKSSNVSIIVDTDQLLETRGKTTKAPTGLDEEFRTIKRSYHRECLKKHPIKEGRKQSS